MLKESAQWALPEVYEQHNRSLRSATGTSKSLLYGIIAQAAQQGLPRNDWHDIATPAYFSNVASKDDNPTSLAHWQESICLVGGSQECHVQKVFALPKTPASLGLEGCSNVLTV